MCSLVPTLFLQHSTKVVRQATKTDNRHSKYRGLVLRCFAAEGLTQCSNRDLKHNRVQKEVQQSSRIAAHLAEDSAALDASTENLTPWEASARWGDKGGSEGLWSGWYFTLSLGRFPWIAYHCLSAATRDDLMECHPSPVRPIPASTSMPPSSKPAAE